MIFHPIEGMGIWSAAEGGYTFAIYHEPGKPDWTEAERAKFIGYSASYRRFDHHRSSDTIHIGLFGTLEEAKAACSERWARIRSAT